jgi:Protein of unknown function (DUF1585)
LKHVLVNTRQRDFYRCLSEKLLTYALGRGLGYDDVEVVDKLVERLDSTSGNATDLLMGVADSVPFQKTRRQGAVVVDGTAGTSGEKRLAGSGGSP